MEKHLLRRTTHFAKSYKKVIRNNKKLLSIIDEVLRRLSTDPFGTSLRTHKVKSVLFGEVYSSRVTGDIRIIWIFDQNKKFILILLEIGGHDEVY